jgi:CRISPR-associated protein Cmr3
MANRKSKKQKRISTKKSASNNQRLNTPESITKVKGLDECQPGQLNFRFQASDTWFFRESRPHDSAGANELGSLFPPPVGSLIGALRTFFGEQINVDWRAFNKNLGGAHAIDGLDFHAAIGDADHLGTLSVMGPWLCFQGERLYPVPFYQMQKECELARLEVGPATHCDLGVVRLPELPTGCGGFQNFSHAWVTRLGMEKLLGNQLLSPDKDIVLEEQLFFKESRLGIARNNETRSVIEGKLYQTEHLRFKDDVSVELDVFGIDALLMDVAPVGHSEVIRLGGEGRMAELQAEKHFQSVPSIQECKTDKIVVNFMTHADFNGAMFPDNFIQKEHEGQTVWEGNIKGIRMIIEAAVIGKVHREGGWDMKNHRPRAVKSFVPAGSAWFCRVLDKDTNVLQLNGQSIGEGTEYGRGQIVIGLWKDNKEVKG